MVSARPDSPGPAVSKTIVFIGEVMLIANRTTANASQPKIAFFRCCALQRAIRAARLREGLRDDMFVSLSDIEATVAAGRRRRIKAIPSDSP